MKKIRVYEYAKKHQLQSKAVIEKLKELNIPVTNHMSSITEDTVRKLDEAFGYRQTKMRDAKPKDAKGKNDRPKRERRAENRPRERKPRRNGRRRHSSPSMRQGQGKGRERQHDHKERPKSVAQASTPEKEAGVQRAKAKPVKKKDSKKQEQEQRVREQKAFVQKKTKKKSRKKEQVRVEQPVKKEKELPKKITYTDSLTVAELAKKLHREPAEIIKKLMMLGVMATINQELDKDAIELICSDYGVEVEEKVTVDLTDLDSFIEPDNPEDLVERPPVVTIMGHVDHGKTTLLDAIRKSKVTEQEAGGITQHIGAYQVKVGEKKITFIDTPGHAAFTTMRARGAKVTDITILVVAADDGVKPQTVEALNHAKAAEVPIIVAVNKIDKPTASPEKVMQELTEYELIPEDWGGDTIFVPISALKGEGIDELLEMILLVAEMEELKANPNRKAYGTVIEAQLDRGRGPVATLLVQNGTLKVGDPVVVGTSFGRVRAMVNDLGKRVKEADPSMPVEITGLNDVPEAGDKFVVFDDEKTARQVGEARAEKVREESRAETNRISLDTLFEQMQEGDVKELNIIIKADVQGTVEALSASLQKIDVEGVKIHIIHTAVGGITESDVLLATASNAIIIGFNVRPNANAKKIAEEEKVEIRLYNVIYKAIEEIEAAMKGLLEPEYREKVIGQVEVRQIFKVSKVGTIAGSYVTEGKVTRDSSVRVIRDGIVIYEGEIDSLKRYKDDVREVAQGYECGITIKNYNDIKEGDVFEVFVMEEVAQS